MRIAVLGAGAMGGAAAVLLGRHADVDLLVLDVDEARAKAVAAGATNRATRTVPESRGVDITSASLEEALGDVQAVAACIPYRLNLRVMEAALASGCGYADLGGLFHTTLKQLELDARFRDAGIAAVLGVGSAPGITNILAKACAERLDSAVSIDLFDGAVEGGGEFSLPYSAETIVDEFTMPAMVFEDGSMKEVPAASGTVPHSFPDPIGEQEAFYTLHSEPATLPASIPGVRDVRWRLALPTAISRGFRLLVDLGLAGQDRVKLRDDEVVPRELLIELLNRLPAQSGPPQDVECIDVVVRGTKEGRAGKVVGRAMLRPTTEGLSAGAFGTAIPIASVTRWMAAGRIAPGVHAPESAVPADEFLQELAAEGVEVSFDEAQDG